MPSNIIVQTTRESILFKVRFSYSNIWSSVVSTILPVLFAACPVCCLSCSYEDSTKPPCDTCDTGCRLNAADVACGGRHANYIISYTHVTSCCVDKTIQLEAISYHRRIRNVWVYYSSIMWSIDCAVTHMYADNARVIVYYIRWLSVV